MRASLSRIRCWTENTAYQSGAIRRRRGRLRRRFPLVLSLTVSRCGMAVAYHSLPIQAIASQGKLKCLTNPLHRTVDTASMFRSLRPGHWLSTALGVDTKCPGPLFRPDIRVKRSLVSRSASSLFPSTKRLGTLKIEHTGSSTASFPERPVCFPRLKSRTFSSARPSRAGEARGPRLSRRRQDPDPGRSQRPTSKRHCSSPRRMASALLGFLPQE
jgi:hypothetical protein